MLTVWINNRDKWYYNRYLNHKVSNLFDHSSRVALCAYDLSRRLHINADGKSPPFKKHY